MLFLLRQEKESAENRGEEPLHGSIFEDIIGIARDDQYDEEKGDEKNRSAKSSIATTRMVGTPEDEEEACEIREIDEETNYASLDIKFYEIIVGFIGTKTRASN